MSQPPQDPPPQDPPPRDSSDPSPAPGPQDQPGEPTGGSSGSSSTPEWTVPGQAPQQPSGPAWGPPAPPPYSTGPGPHPGQPPAQPPGQHPGWSPGPPVPESGGLKKTLLLVAAALVGVLVLVGVLIAVVAGGGDDEGAPAAEGEPADVAKAFMEALADGDAQGASQLLSTPPDDTSLLTDEVLARSKELAPITNLEVGSTTQDQYSPKVAVTYTLGDQPVRTEITMNGGDGAWKVLGGTGYVSFGQFEGVALQVNGVEVTGDQVEVFPGAYQVSTDTPHLELGGDDVVEVTAPFQTGSTSALKPRLDRSGTKIFRTKVKAAAQRCLASRRLKAGCGLALPGKLDDGARLRDGSVERRLTAEGRAGLRSLTPEPDASRPTLVSDIDWSGSVDYTADCDDGNGWQRCSLIFAPPFGTPSMDFSRPKPVVEWD